MAAGRGILVVVCALAMAIVPMVLAVPARATLGGELGWGNGQLVFIGVPPAKFPSPANVMAHENFYEAAPQVPSLGSPKSPQSDACDHLGFVVPTTGCLHDHIIPVQAGNAGTFGVVWHVFLVVCAGNAGSACTAETLSGTLFTGGSATFALAQIVTVGGSPLPLTSVSAIEAAETAGVVTEIDTGVTFICPIQPFGG